MELYEEVDKFCMFIGYPRSGHSLIGALLDSHPNMIMAHELDVLKFIQAGFNKRQIYYLLLKNSRAYAKAGRKWHGYSYEVPNQWQGRFEKLRVIGDKKGGRTTMRLRSNPGLLDLLRTTVNIPIKLIHVVRNPYDNISSASKKFKVNLRDVIKSYFSLCATVAAIKKEIESVEVLDIRHESFIDNPPFYLSKLCNFLGVDAPNDYLESCADIVFKTPHQSRYDVKWNDELIDRVKERIDEFPFLQGSSYEA